MIHIKHFQDPYSQSREHFFLDLLKQQGAPVPQVIKNDISNKELHMTDVGINLQQWLSRLNEGQKNHSNALDMLYECLVCCQTISKLGVWHLDLASRNFMVSEAATHKDIKVHIIDFSLATSPKFPLQKPLWIRPHTQQHHVILRDAVIKDWRTFFSRASLAEPARYDAEFEIPLADYANHWFDHLAVDQLSHPWCVMSHSLGNLLIEASQASCFEPYIAKQLMALGNAAQSLSSDEIAQSQIEKMMTFLQTSHSIETPKPRAQANVYRKSETPEYSVQKDASTQPVVELTEASYWRQILLASLIVVGSYGLADILFSAYRLRLSTVSVMIMMGVTLTSLIGILYGLLKRHFLWSLTKALKWQSLCLATLGLNLWVYDLSEYWGYLFLGLSLLLLFIGKKHQVSKSWHN